MTKQATLIPIDPNVATPLNPVISETQETYPVSVEAANGYLDFAREELGITDPEILADVFIRLADSVQPLVSCILILE